MRWRELQNDIKPAIPYVFLFDDDGGQTFDSTGGFHTWDTTKIITQHFLYTTDTDSIFMQTNSAGLYEVTFECTYSCITECNIIAQVYKNGSVVNGSSVRHFCPSNKKISVSLTFTLYVERDDYIQIRSNTNDNSVTTVSDTSRLRIKFLPMQGWDNGTTAGRSQYTGKVNR